MNVRLGKGNIIGAFTTVAADAKIEDYNSIQSYSIVGNDVQIDDWSLIDSHVICVGGIKIGNHNVVIGLSCYSEC